MYISRSNSILYFSISGCYSPMHASIYIILWLLHIFPARTVHGSTKSLLQLARHNLLSYARSLYPTSSPLSYFCSQGEKSDFIVF
uniref:Uncharacterized protein n=1 Tax=Setaria italica TaxID=4555 RepID=K3Y0F7_SETIT